MRALAPILMCAAASLAFARGSAVADEASLERTGDGLPKCGLGSAFHGGRRAALRRELGAGVVVVRGLPDTRDYVPFRQDKVFWYLTGVESTNAWLVMDCASGREVLLLPDPNKMQEMWEGEQWDAGDAWVKQLTGFAEVLPARDATRVIGEMLADSKKLWVSLHPSLALSGAADRAKPYDRAREKDPFDGRVGREKAFAAKLEETFGVKPSDFAPTLNELRRVKTVEELAAMRRAARSGALAMIEAMRSTRPGIGEWEIDSLMTWFQVKEGAAGPGYMAIVGSGANSLVLHYGANNRRMLEGEVLLVDYAPEVDHSVCDITRTWPVNGKFSARQAELYDAVLASQKAGIAVVKPGAKLEDVESACRRVLEERGFGPLIRHGACHYIGMEVHDVGNAGKPLSVGACFTIEPGLYEPDSSIGIRIEDVVVVTETGCDVISALVPKERAEIEALIASEGVLDWLAVQR
ncbi:MAG: aminopeptidase P family protein [Planctomycetes bacterium]|nr:aminopeptidase P family protein [Planctomycetota bacterium]